MNQISVQIPDFSQIFLVSLLYISEDHNHLMSYLVLKHLIFQFLMLRMSHNPLFIRHMDITQTI